MLDLNNAEAAKDIILYYHDNPVAYAEEVEDYVLDDWQKEALNNLVKHRFLAIRSGSGVGKTFLLSIASKWFLFTRPHAKVPSTAPSGHQLFDVLWTEHFKQLDRSPILSNFFEWTHTRLSVKGQHAPNWYAVARTAKVKPGSDVAEGLQGFHDEKNLLFIVDEASGVPDAIYPAVEGALTGDEGTYCILTGNPTRKDGFFYEIFSNPRMAKYYCRMHISCERDKQTVARVGQRYIDMMEERYGRDHPIFKIKVSGEFPDTDEEYLIPPSYLDSMEHSSKNDVTGFPVEFGLDVGRRNAASVLCIRQGLNVLKWDERQKKGQVTDTNEIVNWTVDYIQEFKPTHVKVDAVGIGAGVYDNLKLIYGNMIVPVIGQQQCEEKYRERYLNLRAQGYWELRNLSPRIFCKVWPPRLISELGNIRTKPTLNAKIKIESKDDMLARSMKSPDYADAMYMAFLSDEACTGVVPPAYQSPTVIAKANEGLKKDPIWAVTDPDMRRTRGRFGAERWGGLHG